MPLWVPGDYAGFSTVDCHKAIAASLMFRPLGDTVQDTLAGLETRRPIGSGVGALRRNEKLNYSISGTQMI